jgi:oxalate decarboxylase
MMRTCKNFLVMALCVIGIGHAAPPPKQIPTASSMEGKIKAFLDKESKNLSSSCPYYLDLFKDGTTAQNKAGVRISETAKQFDGMLTGQLFFYKLYDHSQRVPHWHANAVEMGFVLNGTMKITIWDGPGNYSVFTVDQGGAWMIPQASVHCLENAGSDELDFLVAYNSGDAADRDFSTAWSSLPNAILEKSLGLTGPEISTLKKTTVNRLSTFDPGMPMAEEAGSSPYTILLDSVDYIYNSSLGSIKRVDQTNWPG